MASGEDRARVAAESAVQSPLLEGVDLSGARGILVNITAGRDLKLRETRVAMETIRAFAAEDATIILGTVYDESLGDSLRVTVVATGLGRDRSKASGPTLVHNAMTANPMFGQKTGTDNFGGFPYDQAAVGGVNGSAAATGLSSPAPLAAPAHDYGKYDQPAVWRDPRSQAAARVEALIESGADRLDIPAFLRRQAD
jgi:cell division protein FtsZ